jgi:hypothetical protein
MSFIEAAFDLEKSGRGGHGGGAHAMPHGADETHGGGAHAVPHGADETHGGERILFFASAAGVLGKQDGHAR